MKRPRRKWQIAVECSHGIGFVEKRVCGRQPRIFRHRLIEPFRGLRILSRVHEIAAPSGRPRTPRASHSTRSSDGAAWSRGFHPDGLRYGFRDLPLYSQRMAHVAFERSRPEVRVRRRLNQLRGDAQCPSRFFPPSRER